jgi:hypothetical protein
MSWAANPRAPAGALRRKRFHEATREYARKPFHEHPRWESEQRHNLVLFPGNTGIVTPKAQNGQLLDATFVNGME